jgi:hypothetical protein
VVPVVAQLLASNALSFWATEYFRFNLLDDRRCTGELCLDCRTARPSPPAAPPSKTASGSPFTQLDDLTNSSLADRWLPKAEREEQSLKCQLESELGSSVAGYPVLGIWNRFEPGQQHIGSIAVVDGLRLGEWLRSHPTDLIKAGRRKRERNGCVPSRAPLASRPGSNALPAL